MEIKIKAVKRNHVFNSIVANDEVVNRKYDDRILDILTKPRRGVDDIRELSNFLLSVPSISNILSKERESKARQFLLDQISHSMRHEAKRQNTLIFMYGEKGNKFFTLFSGNVVVLIPIKMVVHCTNLCFVIYLLRLRHFHEFEILRMSVEENKVKSIYDDATIESLYSSSFEKIPQIFEENSSSIELLNSMDSYIYIEDEMDQLILQCMSNKSHSNVHIKRKASSIEHEVEFKTRDSILFTGVSISEYSHRIFPFKEVSFKKSVAFTIFQYKAVKTFNKGDSFGEIALENENSKRTATCIATIEDNVSSLS